MSKKVGAVYFMVRYPSKLGTMLAWHSGGGLTRQEARDRFIKSRKGLTWKQAYRKGCRVVFVNLREM